MRSQLLRNVRRMNLLLSHILLSVYNLLFEFHIRPHFSLFHTLPSPTSDPLNQVCGTKGVISHLLVT